MKCLPYLNLAVVISAVWYMDFVSGSPRQFLCLQVEVLYFASIETEAKKQRDIRISSSI